MLLTRNCSKKSVKIGSRHGLPSRRLLSRNQGGNVGINLSLVGGGRSGKREGKIPNRMMDTQKGPGAEERIGSQFVLVCVFVVGVIVY